MWEFERTALCILIKTLLRLPSNRSNCTRCAHPPNAAREMLSVHGQNECDSLPVTDWTNARRICRVCLRQHRTKHEIKSQSRLFFPIRRLQAGVWEQRWASEDSAPIGRSGCTCTECSPTSAARESCPRGERVTWIIQLQRRRREHLLSTRWSVSECVRAGGMSQTSFVAARSWESLRFKREFCYLTVISNMLGRQSLCLQWAFLVFGTALISKLTKKENYS